MYGMIVVQAEARPELWGKYAYALNRLQGLLRDIGLDTESAGSSFSWWPWDQEELEDLRHVLMTQLQVMASATAKACHSSGVATITH